MQRTCQDILNVEMAQKATSVWDSRHLVLHLACITRYTTPSNEDIEYHTAFDIKDYSERPSGSDAWDVEIEDARPSMSSPLKTDYSTLSLRILANNGYLYRGSRMTDNMSLTLPFGGE